jgi:serine phosphatase RsbU (regulator of sigma subunit)
VRRRRDSRPSLAVDAVMADRGVRAAIVLGLLLGIFLLRVRETDPAVGVSILYVVPTIIGGVWFGRVGGVTVGALAALLFLAGGIFAPQEHLVESTLLRLVIFCTLGFAVALLVHRVRELTSELMFQRRELGELRALRSALVPPEVPERPAVDLATCFVPAQERVAGDFFVVQEGPDEATVVVVGDVVGKGLEAARRAAFVRATLAAYAPYNDDPCRLLELVNATLVEHTGTSEDFVTAACLVYRPEERSLSWALAGHPAPLRLDDGERLNGIAPGLPLGLAERVKCARAERRLAAGDGVLLFTDGLTEARSPRSGAAAAASGGFTYPDLFGDERIAAVLAEHSGEEPGSVVDALRAAAERFTGGGLADDLCMVAVRARE